MLSRAVVCEVDVSAEHTDVSAARQIQELLKLCVHAAFPDTVYNTTPETNRMNDSLDRNRVYLFQRTPPCHGPLCEFW